MKGVSIIDVTNLILALAGLLKMYKEIKTVKKDIDGVAKVAGTERSKGPKK